jgi:hypothetical protein
MLPGTTHRFPDILDALLVTLKAYDLGVLMTRVELEPVRGAPGVHARALQGLATACKHSAEARAGGSGLRR